MPKWPMRPRLAICWATPKQEETKPPAVVPEYAPAGDPAGTLGAGLRKSPNGPAWMEAALNAATVKTKNPFIPLVIP